MKNKCQRLESGQDGFPIPKTSILTPQTSLSDHLFKSYAEFLTGTFLVCSETRYCWRIYFLDPKDLRNQLRQSLTPSLTPSWTVRKFYSKIQQYVICHSLTYSHTHSINHSLNNLINHSLTHTRISNNCSHFAIILLSEIIVII